VTSRVGQFLALEPAQRRWLLRAVPELARARASLGRVPFRRLVAALEQHPQPVDLAQLSPADRERARQVAWAVRAAARHVPWRCECLVQALAGQRLLQRAGIHGMVVLGVSRGPGLEEGETLGAHAWLQCGAEILLGEHGHRRFKPISAFTW
jgi:hypothetical protein